MLEVPSTQTSTDYWGGGWYDYPDKERALAAMEQAGPTDLRRSSANLNRMLKQAADFVLASLRASTYGNKYASALRRGRVERPV